MKLYSTKRDDIPRGFERAILKEYLQCEFLTILTELPGSEYLALIGGTGLRLLYDLDRFSEDLDFDNCGLSPGAPFTLFEQAITVWRKRNYPLRFSAKRVGRERGGKLIIPHLLHELHLSLHAEETIVLKLEYTTPSVLPHRDTRILNRFGFITQLVTEPLPVLCARKIIALFGRQRIQSRDLYDLSWFFAKRITPDLQTLKTYEISSFETLNQRLITFFQKIHPQIKIYEREIIPLLLHPEHARHIRLLPMLTKQMLEKNE